MIAAVGATEVFQAQHARLFALAYRMLGSAVDAEDILQEAWLRFQSVDASQLASSAAWLTKVVTRLCLDQLKSARSRREQYVGPWLPEPVPTEALPVDAKPDAESLSMAFLLLLEMLTPAERAAYLLHEVFEYTHVEVGELLDKTPAHCRQLVLRAREHLAAQRPRFSTSREQHGRLLTGFLAAAQQGDLEGLKQLLSADVVLRSDGGGKASAATKPVVGSERVARFFIGLASKMYGHAQLEARILSLNGWPTLVVIDAGRVAFTLGIEADAECIHSFFSVRNPEKLGAVERQLALDRNRD